MHAFTVASDHPALPGHFPGRPIVPGVVILDHVLAAIESACGPLGTLRLPQVKFMQPLLPGQVAHIALEAIADGDTPRWRFRVESAGATLASGEVVAA
jgi:3-hydroxymyristoyl/3-hydroxydecanoyl-(acyl carrier protein) dehydratase